MTYWILRLAVPSGCSARPPTSLPSVCVCVCECASCRVCVDAFCFWVLRVRGIVVSVSPPHLAARLWTQRRHWQRGFVLPCGRAGSPCVC